MGVVFTARPQGTRRGRGYRNLGEIPVQQAAFGDSMTVGPRHGQPEKTPQGRSQENIALPFSDFLLGLVKGCRDTWT